MELNERCNALGVQRQVVPHSKGVERPHCCAISLPLSLDTSKHNPGSKRSHDPKAGLSGSRRSAHSYSFRIIAEHEARVLHLLLSTGTSRCLATWAALLTVSLLLIPSTVANNCRKRSRANYRKRPVFGNLYEFRWIVCPPPRRRFCASDRKSL